MKTNRFVVPRGGGITPLRAAPRGSSVDATAGATVQRRVVLVDDDPVERSRTAATLARAGFHVTPVASAAAALELVRRVRPDAIVADVLGGADGFELTRQVRCVTELAGVPVMLVSGRDSDDDQRARADAVGAAALVRRTTDGAVEVATLERALAAR